LERRLDRADPAAEGLEPAEERKLALGCSDDEHHTADANGWSDAA
jgi:hypothetical protein